VDGIVELKIGVGQKTKGKTQESSQNFICGEIFLLFCPLH
jgi:hypothetical protein